MPGFLRWIKGGEPARATSTISPEEQFDAVVQATHAVLKVAGFAKLGSKFRKFYGPNVALIQFQRSRYNDANDIRFTINVSVVSAAIVQHLGGLKDLKKASEWHGHLRERIGHFQSSPDDKWWKLDDRSDARLVGDDVVQLVTTAVIPFLDAHSTDEQLLSYWRSGKYGGMTDDQRDKMIAALEKESAQR